MPPDGRVLDGDVNHDSGPHPAISPDGNWVAYVSHGFVCVCNIHEPAPRRILEVPYSTTWDHFTSPDDEVKVTGDFQTISKGLTHDQRNKFIPQVTKTIYGFIWTFDSSGFIFSVASADVSHKKTTHDGYLATVDGKLTNLVHTDSDAKTRINSYGILTRDQKFLVSPTQFGLRDDYRPLICNLKNHNPRATPFLYLTPSATSDRWLGVEKDSRQLVIADENFDVIKRFEVSQQGKSFGFQLDWSPDERFIIWRNQIGFDYFSNWEGFWQSLDTGEKRPLDGEYMHEQIEFTGRGGEFFRYGPEGAHPKGFENAQQTGAHLTIVPEGNSPPRDLWRIAVDPQTRSSPQMLIQGGSSSAHLSSDSRLFAICIPRPPSETPGLMWTVFDRDGHQWRFPGPPHSDFISPYNVVGFAEGGRSIVAYDEKQLFTIPVESITASSNKLP